MSGRRLAIRPDDPHPRTLERHAAAGIIDDPADRGAAMAWNRRHFRRLDLPTLISSGCREEITLPQAQALCDGIAGSERVLFEESAYLARVEERKRYPVVLERFFDRTEANRT